MFILSLQNPICILHSQHNSIWTCHISSAHFNSLHVATIQDDTASEDSTSRLETQNTDIKARATVQQHVTRVLNNEHGTQSLHQIPKLLTYVTFKIFVFSTQKCKGKSLNGKKKKSHYRVKILSQDYTFVVFCVARSLQKLFWHNHSFILHIRERRAVTQPCQPSKWGNPPTCGSISSNRCFKLSVEYAALELRS